MKSIMNDQKVLDFFGQGECFDYIVKDECHHMTCRAVRILRAMEEPIEDGDRYLYYTSDSWKESTAQCCYFSWHPSCLKLPAKFQKSADPVEEKIKKIQKTYSYCDMESDLRELVKLARGEK